MNHISILNLYLTGYMNLFSQRNPNFLKSPTGKLVPADFILLPNYGDITQVKIQIKWCEDVAKFLENQNKELADHYKSLAKLLRTRLQRLAK